MAYVEMRRGASRSHTAFFVPQLRTFTRRSRIVRSPVNGNPFSFHAPVLRLRPKRSRSNQEPGHVGCIRGRQRKSSHGIGIAASKPRAGAGVRPTDPTPHRPDLLRELIRARRAPRVPPCRRKWNCAMIPTGPPPIGVPTSPVTRHSTATRNGQGGRSHGAKPRTQRGTNSEYRTETGQTHFDGKTFDS